MKNLIPLLFLVFVTGMAQANNGLTSVKSSHDVKTTADRLEAVLKKKGMKVFNRINHAEGACHDSVTRRQEPPGDRNDEEE